MLGNKLILFMTAFKPYKEWLGVKFKQAKCIILNIYWPINTWYSGFSVCPVSIGKLSIHDRVGIILYLI